jgi:hypothetical protein
VNRAEFFFRMSGSERDEDRRGGERTWVLHNRAEVHFSSLRELDKADQTKAGEQVSEVRQ